MDMKPECCFSFSISNVENAKCFVLFLWIYFFLNIDPFDIDINNILQKKLGKV